jgi:hypothetical protein
VLQVQAVLGRRHQAKVGRSNHGAPRAGGARAAEQGESQGGGTGKRPSAHSHGAASAHGPIREKVVQWGNQGERTLLGEGGAAETALHESERVATLIFQLWSAGQGAGGCGHLGSITDMGTYVRGTAEATGAGKLTTGTNSRGDV